MEITKEILSKLKNKDQSVLRDLYKNYSGALYGVIFRILDDKEVAEEVLQQTFLKIWKNIDQFKPERSTLFTWMNAIARNSALDKARLKGFQRNKKSAELDPHVYNYDSVEIENSKMDAASLMNKLEDKYREVLDRVYLQGFSHRETAEELDIPLGTIKSRIRIAIRTLREELKDEKNLFIGFLGITL